MAHRPAPEEFDRPLTEEQVRELQRRLSLLSAHQVAEEYRRAYEACRMEGDRLPRAGCSLARSLEMAEKSSTQGCAVIYPKTVPPKKRLPK